jgi:hypothetical protein
MGPEDSQPEDFSVSSEAIAEDNPDTIFKYRYTRQGENISPPVRLHNVPTCCDHVAVALRDVTGSREIPLWVLWGRTPADNQIPEGVPKTGHPENVPTITQGTAVSGEVGYSGPDLTREYDRRDEDTDTAGIQLRAFVFDSELGLSPESEYSDLIQALNDQAQSWTSTSLVAQVATDPEQ